MSEQFSSRMVLPSVPIFLPVRTQSKEGLAFPLPTHTTPFLYRSDLETYINKYVFEPPFVGCIFNALLIGIKTLPETVLRGCHFVTDKAKGQRCLGTQLKGTIVHFKTDPCFWIAQSFQSSSLHCHCLIPQQSTPLGFQYGQRKCRRTFRCLEDLC